MKKIYKIIFICIVLSICLLLFSCSSYSNDRVEYILNNQVPFVAISPPRHFHDYSTIEEDSYGRQLIFCEIPGISIMNDFFENNNNNVFVYLIFQKTTSRNIWIYDDDCYLFVADKDTIDLEFEEFKVVNDWDQPLNEEKMSQYDSSNLASQYKNERSEYGLIWEYKQYIEIGDEEFSEDEIVTSYLKTSKGKGFFIARHAIQMQPPYIYGKTYLFTINEGQITNVKEITGTPLDWKDQIRDYKIFLDSQEQTDVDSASGE